MPFVKADPKINRTKAGPGRSAGYRHYTAELIANLLDSTVSEKDKRPFMLAALQKYKEQVLAGGSSLNSFVDKFYNEGMIERLDSILNGQKTADTNYMKYQLFERCFDEQQQVLLSKKPMSLLVCGRRGGKTEVLATKIAQQAVKGEKGDIIYIGKTYTSAKEIIWQRLLDLFKLVNLPVEALLSEQTIKLANGINIYIRGANNLSDIDKLRGHSYQLAVVDEIQSIKYLKILLVEILAPALQDYKGQMLLAGTPPRFKENYMEVMWNSDSKYIAKYHWDASHNIFMPDYDTLLATVREERQLKETDPVYQREWLGMMGIYDSDAQVFKGSAANNFNKEELEKWVYSQPMNHMFFSAGLDLGYEDSDAFCIVLASSSRPEKWVVYEHKKAKQDISDLVTQIKIGLAQVDGEKMFQMIPNKNGITIQTDMGGGGKKISVELRRQYGLNTVDAIKQDKTMAIEQLREEMRLGRLRYDSKGIWADEVERILYARDESDRLTKLIDEAYHPDFMDCLLYALRPVWKSSNVKLGDPFGDKIGPAIHGPSVYVKPRDYLDDSFQVATTDDLNAEFE